VAIAEGGWSTFSVVYNALPGDVGQTLAIRLSAQAAQGNFDNVRLDATAVPEPASAALVALGLASAWVVRRRRNG
jgi:hypothetical protein